MRIVFLLTQSLESPGGAGRVLPLAKALCRAGHSVRIIALHHDFRSLKERRFLLDGIEVWYVAQMQVRKVGNEKFYFSTPVLLWVMMVAVVQLTLAILSSKADVVQVCKAQPMNIIAAWVKHAFHRTPVLLDSDDYETLNNRFKYAWQQKIVNWFEKSVTGFAREITVINTFLIDLYRSYGFSEERLHLVPHGFDPLRFDVLHLPGAPERVCQIKKSLALENDQKVIVFVGSMSLISHAVDMLLQAMVEVHQWDPRVVLVLVGGGEDFQKIKAEAARLGLETCTRFVGKVPQDAVPWYFKLADVSVDPKKQGELEQSTLSIKVVESMAAEIPCVSARIGDSERIIGDAGLLVDPGDAHALAVGIRTVLEDDARAQQMQLAARQRKASFSWEQHAKTFVSLYERMKSA